MTSRFFPFGALALIAILIMGCKHTSNTVETTSQPDESVRKFTMWNELQKFMQGNFSSRAQSQRDSTYFDIRLRMVPIWENTSETFFLYVEQAIASSQDKPYRQRVYRVENHADTLFVSHIYTLPQPSRFVGLSGDDPLFQQLRPDSLQLKDGCAVYLRFDPNQHAFIGATERNTCPSDRNGASWTTSEVSLREDIMVSWDRGWNAAGVQVWGAEKGGYEFVKQ
ncbi:MAG: chromophore lyase CpcT/CpeT [Flavobacteriales bacterium]